MVIDRNIIEDNIKFFSTISMVGFLFGAYGVFYNNYPVAIIASAFAIWFNLKATMSDMNHHSLKQYQEIIKHLQYLEDRKK